jgi:chloramphenicol 3-O-phosphotransferase
MPELFFITGVSAAGKTTTAQKLAERFEPAVHVKGDVFRRMVVTGRVHMRDDAPPEAKRQLDLRYKLGATTANVYFDAGFNVVLQDIVMGPSVAEVVWMLKGRPLYVVVLVPSVDVVEAREATRAKTAYQPDGPTPADLDRYLRENTPKIGLWLDTSDLTPDESVDEILRRKDEALVSS